MTVTKKDTPFQIIRHRGTPQKAQLPDGTWVYRQDSIFIPELNGLVMCAPYDNHFLYEIPKQVVRLYPGPVYRCTCGGAGIYAGPSGYLMDASPQGKLLLCQVHAVTGKHATGGDRWV